MPSPRSSARPAAATVPPTERRPRSTSAGDHGSPSPRSSRTVSAPVRMRSIRSASWTASSHAHGTGSASRTSMPSASARSRSSVYFSIGKRWRSGSGKRQRSWVQTFTRRRGPPGTARRPRGRRRRPCRRAAGARAARAGSTAARRAPTWRRCRRGPRSAPAWRGRPRRPPRCGRRRGERQLVRLVLPRPAGVVHQRAGVLEPAQDLHQLVLDRLVGADRAAERVALLGVGDRALERDLDRAERLGGDQRLRQVPRGRRVRRPRARVAGAASKRTCPSERVAS